MNFIIITLYNGKLLGLWPNPATLASLPLLKEYYDKWGFTGTVVSFSTEHEIANDAGFSDDNILYSLPIDPSNYQIHVLTENAKHYYIDEPLERR